MVERQASEKSIFLEALEIASPEERASYVEAACGGDPHLREEVEALLRAYDRPRRLLDSPGSLAPTLAQEPLTERVGSLVGPYKLMEQIGEGGMGVVYVAEQTQPVRRKVALKVIKPGMDSNQVIARFEAERQALAMMDHPNIARVLDAGTAPSGRPYFVMELVRGIPITDYCDRERLSIRERLELFVLVCRAVQHAHQKGVIHRDLKPSNILVTAIDGVAVPKVIDFGVAKATGATLTERTIYTAFHLMVGTPLYMSPEQADLSGTDVDTRSDIYSLGVLLYELLTGTTPFDAAALGKAAFDEMRRIIREDDPPTPSRRLSGLGEALTATTMKRSSDPRHLDRAVRGELDWIAMKALEKARARRYETANDFAADVMRYLTDRPVEACPPSARYRFAKFARRNRAAITTASVLVAALVVGTALSTWQALLARRAERDAVAAWAEESRQRGRAAEEAERARRSEADTQAFSDFLVDDVLAVARPKGLQGGRGIGVTVVQALEAAEANLEQRFAGRPLAEATARNALGKTWRNLGHFELAERHLRRAVELREQGLGASDVATLDSCNSLGVLLNQAGRHDEAVALHERTLKELATRLGPDHPLTLSSTNNLAASYEGAGELGRALSLYEATAKKQKERLGSDDPSTLLTMTNLARAYQAAGRLDQALTLAEQTLERQKAILGPEHANTLTSMNNLASAYKAAGRYDQALTLAEQTLEKGRATLGPEHPETLTTLNNLAGTFWAMKRLDRSIALFEELLPDMKRKLGEDHPKTLSTMANLGVNYRDAGRLAEAIPLLEVVHRKSPDHPSLWSIGQDLVSAYIRAGNEAEAAALITSELAIDRRRAGAGSPQLGNRLAIWGMQRMNLKAFADAEPLFRECLTIRERSAADAWTTSYTRCLIGASLLGQKKYAEAEPLLLAGYEGMKQREGQIPPQGKIRLTEALERVVQLYDDWGRKDKADEWRKQLPVVNSANAGEPKRD